jgi:hypothetical protein
MQQIEFDLFVNRNGQMFLTPSNNNNQYQWAPPEWLEQTVPKRKPHNATFPAHAHMLPWERCNKSDSSVCVICMDAIEKWGKKLPCGHTFHLKCLMQALEHKTQCPMCRQMFETPKSLLKFPGKKHCR